jgi:hypothetical protein
MSDKEAYKPTVRRILAAIAACLMLLHTVALGALAAEPIGLDAGFFVICSAHGGAPDAPPPTDHGSQHAPCALCGLGHCAVATPPAVALPLEFATAVAAEIPAVAPVMVPTRYVDASRPRGPPGPA